MKWISKLKVKQSSNKPWFEKKTLNGTTREQEIILSKFKKGIDFTPTHYSTNNTIEQSVSSSEGSLYSNAPLQNLQFSTHASAEPATPQHINQEPIKKKAIVLESLPPIYNNIQLKPQAFRFREPTKETFQDIIESIKQTPYIAPQKKYAVTPNHYNHPYEQESPSFKGFEIDETVLPNTVPNIYNDTLEHKNKDYKSDIWDTEEANLPNTVPNIYNDTLEHKNKDYKSDIWDTEEANLPNTVPNIYNDTLEHQNKDYKSDIWDTEEAIFSDTVLSIYNTLEDETKDHKREIPKIENEIIFLENTSNPYNDTLASSTIKFVKEEPNIVEYIPSIHNIEEIIVDNNLQEQSHIPSNNEEELTIETIPNINFSSFSSNTLETDTPITSIEELPLGNKNNLDNTILEPRLYSHNSITPRLYTTKKYSIPLNILSRSKDSIDYDPEKIQAITDEMKHTIYTLETTLKQFGVKGQVVGTQHGPIITRLEYKPAPGIKVSKIISLRDDIAMALEAIRIRIEAPIPGRSTVGIEIPNKERSDVLLGDLVDEPAFQEYSGHLPLALGRDIAGNLMIADMTKLPHLLIAGATGSGKSVLVNSFIINLILRKSPQELRFILIDPKLVELSQYNDIPHLLYPVITTPLKAIQALNWVTEEMEQRYADLLHENVRDIRGYNDKVNDPKNMMPYIVVLIDEIGDLMMVSGKDLENSVIRIAQKARAVGIHLIMATQRPTADVINGNIKSNCPARIGLQVASQVDSRTILDSTGAEDLLGAGDSLFKSPLQAQVLRIQSPFVEDSEIEEIIKQAKEYCSPIYIHLDDEIAPAEPKEVSKNEDPLTEEAWRIIETDQQASASWLQRRLNIGYNRAAKIIETFEAKGYIGQSKGSSKPRDIYGRPKSE